MNDWKYLYRIEIILSRNIFQYSSINTTRNKYTLTDLNDVTNVNTYSVM